MPRHTRPSILSNRKQIVYGWISYLLFLQQEEPLVSIDVFSVELLHYNTEIASMPIVFGSKRP